MTADDFKPSDWIESLSQALARLAAAQNLYADELLQPHRQRARRDGDIFWPTERDHPSYDLQALYSRACRGQSRSFQERYGPLRSALADARLALARHPVWSNLIDPSDSQVSFWTEIAGDGSLGSLSDIIAGLMARAMEPGEDGFRLAASELHGLVAPSKVSERPPRLGDLSTGYHVVLLYGLCVAEESPVLGDMALVPFEQTRSFVNKDVLNDIAPEVIRFNGCNSVAALVRPLRWKPAFRESGGDTRSDLDWGGTFFEDAEAFVELLAMFHAAPAICLAAIPYCIHQTASSLLGRPHYRRSYTWGPRARSFDKRTRSVNLDPCALQEARDAFAKRRSRWYPDCAPIIARLAEALTRTGQFRTDDRILDVAIALEQMYELDGGEISFKLKTRAACFLETDEPARLQVFRDLNDFYAKRSAIVHRRRKQPPPEKKADAFDKAFAIARRTVVRLLTDGPPTDWNELVIGGSPHRLNNPRRSAGTTSPGYRNRNSQVVVRRTGLPGNDHNQRVYVLRCDRCMHRYGANGSDIWQRRCPRCDGGRPGLSIDEE